MNQQWLDWVRRLQAIAQNGLAYAKDPYDLEHYKQVRGMVAAIAASRSEATIDHIERLFSQESGYVTPKLDILAVVLDEKGTVLLVKEKEDGLWTLLGGWVDVGESPSEAAEREVKEESGYQVRAVRLLALWDRDKPPTHSCPFTYTSSSSSANCWGRTVEDEHGDRGGRFLPQRRAAGAFPRSCHPAAD